MNLTIGITKNIAQDLTESAIDAGETLWQPTDLSSIANNWKADSGITESGGVISSWVDDVGSETLSMTAVNNRPNLVQTGGFDIIDMTPDGFSKVLTLDGGLTTQPALAALDQLTGYIAISFLTTQSSSGGLLSVADVAAILPYWSGSPLMYVPSQASDGINNIGNSGVVFNQWHVITLNFKSDSVVIRLDGVDIYTIGSAKSYNFNRFSLNRRISTGVTGYNKIREIIVCDDGLSDADNLLVEGYMTQDISNAPA